MPEFFSENSSSNLLWSGAPIVVMGLSQVYCYVPLCAAAAAAAAAAFPIMQQHHTCAKKAFITMWFKRTRHKHIGMKTKTYSRKTNCFLPRFCGVCGIEGFVPLPRSHHSLLRIPLQGKFFTAFGWKEMGGVRPALQVIVQGTCGTMVLTHQENNDCDAFWGVGWSSHSPTLRPMNYIYLLTCSRQGP